MKEKIKNFLKNPIQKSISSLIFSVFGFLLVRFNGATALDGLISGFGLTLFFLSIFSFSFSLCEAVSEWMKRDKEKEKEKKKKKINKKKITKRN